MGLCINAYATPIIPLGFPLYLSFVQFRFPPSSAQNQHTHAISFCVMQWASAFCISSAINRALIVRPKIESQTPKLTPTRCPISTSQTDRHPPIYMYYPTSISSQIQHKYHHHPLYQPITKTHDFLNGPVSSLQAILDHHNPKTSQVSTSESGSILLPSLAKKSGPFPTVRRTWNLPTHSEVFFVVERIA